MDEVDAPYVRLAAIAKTLREGGPSPRLSVRDFLSWFGVQRRGSWKVRSIRASLKHAGLRTAPDFDSTWIDGPIIFELTEIGAKSVSGEAGETDGSQESQVPAELESPAGGPVLGSSSNADSAPAEEAVSGPEAPGPAESRPAPGPDSAAEADVGSPLEPEEEVASEELRLDGPRHEISKLQHAGIAPQRVPPDAPLMQVITIMLTNNYSQVPVMPNEREVKGVVTWQSIGSKLAFGSGAATVREVMDKRAAEVPSDASIFDAIPILIESGYVLVRGPDGRIAGIVTSSDLSLQFQELAEPFLLLGDIETRIRYIIADRFGLADLSSVRDPNNENSKIESVDDLSFGQYVRLLENPEMWPRAGLKVDRRTFIRYLENVHRIRNAVMHFDPDSTTVDDLQSLRDFARFLQRLKVLGVA